MKIYKIEHLESTAIIFDIQTDSFCILPGDTVMFRCHVLLDEDIEL